MFTEIIFNGTGPFDTPMGWLEHLNSLIICYKMGFKIVTSHHVELCLKTHFTSKFPVCQCLQFR